MPRFGMHEYTQSEHQAIQKSLRQRLGSYFVSLQDGPEEEQVTSVDLWKLINIANETFGFNGWSHSICEQHIDVLEEHNGKFHIGVSSVIKVELKDGTHHESVGYGVCDGAESKAFALGKARHDSVNDGLKRALKNFGNSLGNCLDDRDFIDFIATKTPCQIPVSSKSYSVADMKHKFTDDQIQNSWYSTNSIASEDNRQKERTESSEQHRKVAQPHVPAIETAKCTSSPGSHNPVKSEEVTPTKPTSPISEDEARSLRKLRQKQKQEEYKEKMLLKVRENLQTCLDQLNPNECLTDLEQAALLEERDNRPEVQQIQQKEPLNFSSVVNGHACSSSGTNAVSVDKVTTSGIQTNIAHEGISSGDLRLEKAWNIPQKGGIYSPLNMSTVNSHHAASTSCSRNLFPSVGSLATYPGEATTRDIKPNVNHLGGVLGNERKKARIQGFGDETYRPSAR